MGLWVGKSEDRESRSDAAYDRQNRLFLTNLAEIGAKPRQLGFVGIPGKGYNPAGSTLTTSVQTGRFCSFAFQHLVLLVEFLRASQRFSSPWPLKA